MTHQPSHPLPVLLRVAILNDYEIVVAGLAVALRRHGLDFLFVSPAEVATADVVLYDPFAHSGGWDAVSALLAYGARVVVFGWEAPSAARYLDYLASGVLGFIDKSGTAEEIITALRTVAAGAVAQPTGASPEQLLGSWPGKSEGLSSREAETIAFIAQGMTNVEIAAASFLSINTIKTHIRSAYAKMGVDSRTRAILWAIDHGLGQNARLG